jgi:site-specific recombinase XerD
MDTATYAPDALASLRESFALHLDATRAPKTARIYLDALDSLIAHLQAHGMPLAARGVRREHIESYLAARKPNVAPSTLSLEYRALQQFFRWLVEEDEIDRDPTEKMRAPTVPDSPVPIVSPADSRSCSGRPRARTSPADATRRSCSPCTTPGCGPASWSV